VANLDSAPAGDVPDGAFRTSPTRKRGKISAVSSLARRASVGPGAFLTNRISRVSHANFPLIVYAFVLLLMLDIAVRLFGILPVWRMLRTRQRMRSPTGNVRKSATTDLLWAVRCAARHHLYSMSCLNQSLTLAWLLATRGDKVVLRLGVSKQGERLEAHAWVELDGVALDCTGGLNRRFHPVDNGWRILSGPSNLM
jgi:hypothetical protein